MKKIIFKPLLLLILSSSVLFGTVEIDNTETKLETTGSSLSSRLCKAALQGLIKGTIEQILFIGSAAGIGFVAKPLYYHYQQKEFKAPPSVQDLAVVFLDTMVKTNESSFFVAYCKKRVGYITIYEGAAETYFQKRPRAAAVSIGLNGIHFPAKTFTENTITHTQLFNLCHEVAHIYHGHTINATTIISNVLQPHNPKQPLESSEEWYHDEYVAQYTAVKTLYELGMHETLENKLLSYLIDMSITPKNEYLTTQHPYFFGFTDAFYEVYKDCPEKVPHEATQAFLDGIRVHDLNNEHNPSCESRHAYWATHY